ncbi:cilia- and flagella-associated protein 157-like [Pseudoliparis swirei]|uniref:cilia- and flagella-associated protein 157-like n=1 Tax=Pseudoliparis swirei TaxID=2059687 RepID=UPI0024BD82CC|nr:cilia- and flagella-associated protein 157-like [Pseudoliparis swirei]
MPKNKEKKQDDVKKTQKKENSSSPAAGSGSEDREKELYLLQARHLSEQLERYQLESDHQERRQKELISRYAALEKEKSDIVHFLKRSVLEKEVEAEELTEQLESQRRAAGEQEAALRLQLEELREELRGRVEELHQENTTLASRLAGLQEYQAQKEQLISDLDSLRQQLTNQEQRHGVALHGLEMSALLEKRRWQEELEEQAAAMEARVQHLVDQKVPEATRAALQENGEVKARIGQLADQHLVLMGENLDLRGREGRLGLDLDLLEERVRETTRRSCIRKKVVEQLTVKCRQLQAELEDGRQQGERLQSDHAGVLVELEALRRDRASLSERSADGTAEVSRLEAELQDERRRSNRMRSIMREAAEALRGALREVRTDREEDEGEELEGWKQLMEKLLLLLLDRPKHDRLEEPLTSDLSASGALVLDPVVLDPALSLRFQLARYRPGDLGLVPQLKQKVSARGTLNRKPSNQNAAGSLTRADSRKSFTGPK